VNECDLCNCPWGSNTKFMKSNVADLDQGNPENTTSTN
jgi:hypothetical protein